MAKNALRPSIRYALIGELKIYQVHEHELRKLAEGSPASLSLNIALVLIPFAIGMGVTLATTTASDRVYYSLLILAIVAGIVGLVVLAHWWKSYRSVPLLLDEIINRMEPAEGIQEEPLN